jgi:hypothetical protein
VTALIVVLAVAVVVLAVVLVANYRPRLLTRPVAAARRMWRRRTGADYGRHAPGAQTWQMRDGAPGVDWTGPIPRRVPRQR